MTVRMTGGEVTPLYVAVMLVIDVTAAPVPNVTKPVAPTLAIDELADIQVTLEVRSVVVPFEYVPVAASWRVVPIPI